jgi:elongation factor G
LKEYGPQAIRNCVLAGHGASGKTSLAEAILFFTKTTNRHGNVDDGNSHLDYDDEEKRRKISIRSAVASIDWKNIHLNLIDTPGFDDFIGEPCAAMRVAGNAIITVDAVSGAEVGSERAFEMAHAGNHSILFVITKLEKHNANFERAAASLRERLSKLAIPVQIPIGEGEKHEGLIDLIHMKAYTFAKDGSGNAKEGDVPANLLDAAKAAREKLIEAVAEVDDELTEKFFEEGGNLTEEEFTTGLRKGVNQGKLFPILIASGKPVNGIANLLEFLASEGSSPMDRPPAKAAEGDASRPRTVEAPMSALVWKTLSEPHVGELSFIRVYSGTLNAGTDTFNATKNRHEKIGQLFKMVGRERKEVARAIAGDFVCAVKLRETLTGDTLCDKAHAIVYPGVKFPTPLHEVALHTKDKSEEEKIGGALHRFHEEDPTFHHRFDSETRETILSGMGDIHLDVIMHRLKDRYGIAVDLTAPRIPYRETIRGKADVQGRHKKQTGGRGQFGDVYVKFEPRPRGSGFEFANEVVGGSVPKNFIPAVEKGIVEAMVEGSLAGYPIVDLKATIYDGSYHSVDSSEMAFKIAGQLALRKGMEEAKEILLEPIMEITVTVPDDYMGDVMGDLSSRRGKILGMGSDGGKQQIRATVPLAELYHYSTHLRSITQGRGGYARAFSHYEEVPRENAEKVIAEAQAAKKAAEQS